MERRFAMVCLHETDTMEDGTVRYIPCCIKEGVAGYFPMRGNPDKLQSAWYWGKTHEECSEICDIYNQDLGLTAKDVREIIASSMRASR